MTSTGSSSPKWLIDDPEGALDAEARASYWEDLHATADYDNVYSLTDDSVLRSLLVQELKAAGAEDILIPGCGSRVSLQRSIVDELQKAVVTCADFAGVVDIAAARLSHPRIQYYSANIAELTDRDRYDAVVHVTSVVSESDAENREIISRTVSALKPGGLFLGIFPTVFATLDIAYTTREEWRAESIDLARSSFSEPKQGISQVFYTPLRLRRIAAEAGLQDVSMQLFFNDSDYLRAEGRKHYDLTDPDAVLYHLYLKRRRAR